MWKSKFNMESRFKIIILWPAKITPIQIWTCIVTLLWHIDVIVTNSWKPTQKSSWSHYSLTWVDFWVLVAHVSVAAVRMLAVVGRGALERPVRWVKLILLNALTLLYYDLSGRLCDDRITQAGCVTCPIHTSLTITQQSWLRREKETPG